MIKNFFLTGPRGIGKSTLMSQIRTQLPEYTWGGFFTEPIFDSDSNFIGYCLRSLDSDKGEVVAELISSVPQNQFRVFTEIFNGFASTILVKASISCDFILMDELGGFELNAAKFQQAVFDVLDSSKMVLGVIKQKPNPFLLQITARPDAAVYEVSEANREDLDWRVVQGIRRVLSEICR